MNTIDSDIAPWYKQFWAWFILAPLIMVVIVSSITVTIAVKYADDRVLDNYYKEGRMINMRVDEDLLAQQLSVQAQLNFDKEIDKLGVQLSQQQSTWPDTLLLEFSHPVKAELDFNLRLAHIANGYYQSELNQVALENRWYLRLLPVVDKDEQRWRLRGEIDFSQSARVLLQYESE